MLSRDFVYAFLLGQIQAGVDEAQAKLNFQDWLGKQTDAVVSSLEKRAIASDLQSYSVSQKL